MRFRALLSVALLSLLIEIDGLKILAVLPFGGKSHWAIGHAIVKSLVEVGHEATVVSTYRLENPIKSYREIDISSVLETHDTEQESSPVSAISKMMSLHRMGNELVEAVMSHHNVRELMKSKEKFDVCFLENYYANALTGIFEHFGCIYVPFTTTSSAHLVDTVTSNYSPPSYVPSIFLPYSGELTFSQRWINAFYRGAESLIYYANQITFHSSLYRKHFPTAKRSLNEMTRSSRVGLINSHFSLTGARPLLQNIVEIAGVHIERKRALPMDLKGVLDFADTGAVIVSMGSSENSSFHLPTSKREVLVKAFGRMKQKVIWKYENETLQDQPDNVVISKWLPLRDLLTHHNVRLLITHSRGYLSMIEALSEGIPILMIGDEESYVTSMVEQNCGLILDYEHLSDERLLSAVNALIEDPKYKQNAEIIAQRFKDRTISPAQSVVYWTEFVTRTDGAPHLQSAGKNLSFLEYHSLDVYALMFLPAFILCFTCYLMLHAVYRKCIGRNPDKLKKH